jgi:hypothetical protein
MEMTGADAQSVADAERLNGDPTAAPLAGVLTVIALELDVGDEGVGDGDGAGDGAVEASEKLRDGEPPHPAVIAAATENKQSTRK